MMELRDIDHTGLRVDERGRITDWMEFPPSQPRPLPLSDRQRRQVFTDEQEVNLLEWCTAAQMQGLMGAGIFEQLAALVRFHASKSSRM